MFIATLLLLCFAYHPPDVLVICPPGLRESLQPWVEYRQAQGYRILVEAPEPSSVELKRKIRTIAKAGGLQTLLLIGDSTPGPNSVPTDMRLSQVNFFFGSELDIATDIPYSDTNDDGMLDLAVARLPVNTPEELTRFISRVKTYENNQSFSEWRRKINIVAGVGGFGAITDRTIENTVKILLADFIPPAYDVSMTYGSWSSPYCPDPRRFSEVTLERMNEGCLYWVYVGHGSRHRLDLLRTPIGRFPIMDLAGAAMVAPRQGSPIALFLACHTGAFDDPNDSLAETLLNQPNGPIAVVSGTRVTMPTAMSLLALEMMNEQFYGESRNLGQLLLKSKLEMLRPTPEGRTAKFREMIIGTNFLLSPRPDLLGQEIREHVYMFHLLGDPLLRVQRPASLELDPAAISTAGDVFFVQGNAPFEGQMKVEVCYSRDRLRHRPMQRDRASLTDSGMNRFQSDYLDATDLVCTAKSQSVEAGRFEFQLDVPRDADGQAVVRAALIGDDGFAVGGERIEIRAAPPTPAVEKK